MRIFGDDLQAVEDAMLHLQKQDVLFLQQLLRFVEKRLLSLSISRAACDVVERKQNRLMLILRKKTSLTCTIMQHWPMRGNSLSISKVVGAACSGMTLLISEARPGTFRRPSRISSDRVTNDIFDCRVKLAQKRATRYRDVQLAVKHKQWVAHRVDDRLREERRVFSVQRVRGDLKNPPLLHGSGARSPNSVS